MDELTKLYENFCNEYNYPNLPADELLYSLREEGHYNQEHVEWLESLLELWDKTLSLDL